MERLSKQIAAQRQSIDKLERDEKRLAALIDQLSRVLAEQARREAEREAARKDHGKRREGKRHAPRSTPRPAAAPVRTPPARAGRRAARRAASLPRCAAACRCRSFGEITGRFGTARKVEGAGTAPTWKGIFIRAPAGTGVRAWRSGRSSSPTGCAASGT